MGAAVRSALAVAVAARVPVLLWGGAGLGKSSAVREMAGVAGLPCETVIASIPEPSGFAGLPILAGGGKTGPVRPPPSAQAPPAPRAPARFLARVSHA